MRTRLIRAATTGACVAFVTLALSGHHSVAGSGGRTVSFQPPPHPHAIGTQVDGITTWVGSVTISPPASVHRLGLTYSEVRGTISGVGWGGQPVALRCHYTYEHAYVVRIPPAWDGGLVIFRHGSAGLPLWENLEAAFGPRNLGRIFHESVDRHVSDVALHPNRRWAFFAVNQTGVAPGGAHNTRLLGGEPGCVEGAATQSAVDASIGRDHALLAQWLLEALRGRTPSMTLSVGHSSGAVANLLMNAGLDHRRGPVVRTGDNHRVPYDPASGRIVDGFLSLQGGFMGPPFPSAHAAGLSAPTIFLTTEADRGAQGPVTVISQMAASGDVPVQDLARLYSVLNVPHIDSDLVWSLKRQGTVFSDPVRPEHFAGGGERLKPVTAALLDALADWVKWGIPPPRSVFNGSVQADGIEFHRTSPPATSFPYVDDETHDTYEQPPPIVPNAALRAAWTATRSALGADVGSVVLPETRCRRGSFHYFGMGPIGTHFVPFDEAVFLGRWGSAASHNTCRVQTVEALAAAGFYDPSVVTIDIEPTRFPNVISLGADRVTVAILSTHGFDATEVVPGSLRFASASMHGRRHLRARFVRERPT